MPSDPPKPKHDHATLTFPEGFLWGAATSAFQVEGDIKDSDWWEWEQNAQPIEKRSGKAADQYNRYEKDFDLIKDLGHNTHRLGIEWSRIEPKEGQFDQKEIDHYIKVLQALKKRGIFVMLTLHHFSNPAWFAHSGGWEDNKAPFYFERFVKRVVPELRPYVDHWITINEPGVYSYLAYRSQEFPPQKKSWWSWFKVFRNMARAHKRAYEVIHSEVPGAQVGVAHAVLTYNVFHRHSILENIAAWFADIATNHTFIFLTGKGCHDFIGLNYYMNQYISFNGEARLPTVVDISRSQREVSDLGWEIHPGGIFEIIMDFSDYHLPIYITENGVASTNDDRRVRFLLSYLHEVYHAIQMGVEVKGYYYWSLIDNMELHRGFDPRFGLIEVDFKTQKRTPRPSSFVYREIIKNNGIPHYLLKLLGHGINVEEEMKKWPQEGGKHQE